MNTDECFGIVLNFIFQVVSAVIGSFFGYRLGCLQERKRRRSDFLMDELTRYETDVANGIDGILKRINEENFTPDENKKTSLAFVKSLKNQTMYVIRIINDMNEKRFMPSFHRKNETELESMKNEARRLYSVVTGDAFTESNSFLPKHEEMLLAKVHFIEAIHKLKLALISQ